MEGDKKVEWMIHVLCDMWAHRIWTKSINHKNKQSGKYIITSVYITSYHFHTDAPVAAIPLVRQATIQVLASCAIQSILLIH